jgi:hypothetical protein
MRGRPADDGREPGPAEGAIPGRWRQQSGFSVFFDTRRGGTGERRWRTRLYHEETGDEATFPDSEPTEWVRWMLGRLEPARPPSERNGTLASVVFMEIIDARLAGDPVSRAGDDSVGVELRLQVTGMAELNRALGARVVGVLFGPQPR